MSYNPMKYGSLLAETLPGIIADDSEYSRLEAVFNTLVNKGETRLSPEESRLFALLANLLEDYESRTLTRLETSTPAASLRFLMDENGLKQKDLESVFGSQGVLSLVLNGKRSISKAQAKRLSERFNVAVDIFI